LEAQEQRTLGKRLAQFQKLDLLTLDEVGFVPFTPDGARLLFQVLADRYLRGSVVIITNLEFSRWVEVFGDERLTGALLDRLTHRCHVLEFNGDSYRFKESLHTQEAQI
jgi:DNA replication protein DnaC